MYFVFFPYNTDKMTGSFTVAEVDVESIPATQSLALFQGRYLSLQKFHSCFHMVVHSF